MAWVAMDRAVRAVERFGLEGPVVQWRRIRDVIHARVCRQGFDADVNAFVRFYGAKDIDASLLMIPLMNFLPATDPRMKGMVQAIQQRLMHHGLIQRYHAVPAIDDLPSG